MESLKKLFIVGFGCSMAAIATAQEPHKPAEVAAYEQCAKRVFSKSKKVSDVFAECEAEMEQYLALQDERAREKVRQLTMAETQRALRASTRTSE